MKTKRKKKFDSCEIWILAQAFPFSIVIKRTARFATYLSKLLLVKCINLKDAKKLDMFSRNLLSPYEGIEWVFALAPKWERRKQKNESASGHGAEWVYDAKEYIETVLDSFPW